MVIISFKKQRKIDLSKVSLTGHITSVKNNTIVDFESSLERDFIFLLEHDAEISKYYEQPIKINYFESGFNKYYVPDFFVEYYDNRKVIVEVKYKKDLIENKKKYETKFNAAKLFCEKNNFEFQIISENQIRTEKLFNAKFLLYYKNPLLKLDHNYVRVIHRKVKKMKRISVIDLVESMTGDYQKKAELIYVVWYMVANELLYYEKNCKLTMNSLVWTN
jgi:hypothetical protein